MMMTFETGDFVRVKDTVHDESMPPSRMGHLVNRVTALPHYTARLDETTRVWMILMTNGNMLKFHEMYLEHVR